MMGRAITCLLLILFDAQGVRGQYGSRSLGKGSCEKRHKHFGKLSLARLMKATPGHAKVGVCPESEVSEQMSCVWSLEAVVDGPAVAGWVVGAAGQTRSRRLLHSTAPSEAIYFVG